ncbi:hypothetical protein KSS87_003273 [Heliosperma pusillum]|nr:hypothetical protein KSS87_003273 [Heliosperma pusillum]
MLATVQNKFRLSFVAVISTCLYLDSLFCRYISESRADGAFAISEDTKNEPLSRGTELREEAGGYFEKAKLKDDGKLKLCCYANTVHSPWQRRRHRKISGHCKAVMLDDVTGHWQCPFVKSMA